MASQSNAVPDPSISPFLEAVRKRTSVPYALIICLLNELKHNQQRTSTVAPKSVFHESATINASFFLPEEIVLMIFHHLNYLDIKRLQVISRQFKRISEEPTLDYKMFRGKACSEVSEATSFTLHPLFECLEGRVDKTIDDIFVLAYGNVAALRLKDATIAHENATFPPVQTMTLCRLPAGWQAGVLWEPIVIDVRRDSGQSSKEDDASDDGDKRTITILDVMKAIVAAMTVPMPWRCSNIHEPPLKTTLKTCETCPGMWFRAMFIGPRPTPEEWAISGLRIGIEPFWYRDTLTTRVSLAVHCNL